MLEYGTTMDMARRNRPVVVDVCDDVHADDVRTASGTTRLSAIVISMYDMCDNRNHDVTSLLSEVCQV